MPQERRRRCSSNWLEITEAIHPVNLAGVRRRIRASTEAKPQALDTAPENFLSWDWPFNCDEKSLTKETIRKEELSLPGARYGRLISRSSAA